MFMSKQEHALLADSLQKLGGQHHRRTIELNIFEGRNEALGKLKALASEPRLRILDYLTNPFKLSNLTDMAKALDMNLATVTMHVNILEDAGLIICDHIPGERGTQRVCGCFCNWVNVRTEPSLEPEVGHFLDYEMPIGAYFDFRLRQLVACLVSISKLVSMMTQVPFTMLIEPRLNSSGFIVVISSIAFPIT